MSDLPISSPYRDRPDAVVSEEERNRLTGRLNAAFEAGAMDEDEYRARLDRVWSAGRMGELATVVEGLPPTPTHAQPAIVASDPAGRPGELAPIRSASRAVVLVGAGVAALVLVLVILLVVAR